MDHTTPSPSREQPAWVADFSSNSGISSSGRCGSPSAPASKWSRLRSNSKRRRALLYSILDCQPAILKHRPRNEELLDA